MEQPCLICHSDTDVSVHHKFGQFHWCRTCDFIYKNKKDHIQPTEALKIYNQHQNSVHDPSYVAYFERFIQATVTPFIGEGKKGLDFGSGPEPVLATVLSERYGYDMAIYDLFYAPEKVYEGHTYDVITCTEVVEHLEDPLAVFQLLKSLLKPEGILCIMTQHHPTSLEDFMNWHYIRDRSHIAFYTEKTMAMIAKRMGFCVVGNSHQRYTTFSLEGFK